MILLLRHRQTKGTETDRLDLMLPRHISTLLFAAKAAPAFTVVKIKTTKQVLASVFSVSLW